jgi:hypothetical protein
MVYITKFRYLKLSGVGLLMTLLGSSFGAVLATNTVSDNSQGSGIGFEEFCHLFAMYKSNGDTAEYEKIYNALISTEVIVVPAADRTVAQPVWLSEKSSAGTQITRANNYLGFINASPDMYTKPGGVLIGYVTNVVNMLGTPDNKYAQLVTTGWYMDPLFPNDYSKAIAGEAITNGAFTGTYSNAIIVRNVYTDKTSWDNYFVVQRYYNGVWTYIAASQVKNTLPMDYIFGNTAQVANVSVTCVTMPPPYPTGQSMLLNSVFVDAVEI